MTRKKSNKIASNNNNSDRPTKNIIKNNNNTIEAAFKRIQNTRQCPKCNKKVDYSVYLQHYEKCKNREEEEVEEDDDDIIFCGEGQGHKENEQEASEFNNSKKNLKRTDKSSVVVNVEDDDSQSNLESPRSSALNSGIVSRDVIDGNVRRAPASPITICDDSSNEVPITVFKPKNYCSDLPLAQIYDLCVERLEDFLSEQEELLRNLPPPKCDTNRPLDLTDENDSLMDPPPTENVSNKLLPVHYSLRFVWQILQKALHCVKNGHENILETATKFWGDSLRKVYSFLTTSVPAQQLFCRILVRRRGFHIARNIRYHDLGPKLMPLFIELCENGFFEEAFSINENGDPNSSNITLDEAFNLLQVDDFKIICKKFHIDTRIGRQGIIRELKKHAIRRDVFGRCNLKHLLNCIKQLTGKCYRIKQDVLYFFNSFFSVYAPNLMDVGAAAVRPHQCYVDLCDSLIFSMLQRQAETLNFVNNLNLKYSLIDLFSDFDGLTRYVKAKYDEQRLVCFIDKSLFEEAKSVAAELKELFSKEFLDGEEDAKIFQFINLPVYLRKFTPPWIYCRCIFRGVEAAQRLRDYELAVNWLIFLLSKEELKHFCINSRGRWYKRLVLNLNKHLKRNEEAAKFCCKGIEENFVLISDKLSLQERLDKLSQRVVDCPQALLENRLVLDEPERVSITGLTLGKGLGDGLQVNHFYIPSTSTQPNLNENVQPETIQSDTLSSSSDTSSCSSFASTRRGGSSEHQQPSTQTTTAPTNNTNINKCNVEEIALRHFIENENYKEGVHAEGKIWHMLFRLFFWDIISCVEFENELANNVWISWMQNDPLDLNYTMFYENRLTLIDSRLEKILESLSECILLNKTPSTTFEERISSSTGSPQRKSPRKSVHCPCFIHSTVEKHYNEKLSKTMGNSARSSTIEWHDFEGGKEQLFRFLHCCSPVLLHALFKKLCSNFRQSRSGFPDLTLWNAEDRKLAVVEVKGPNDKLSTKQQIWLDFFKSQGVRAVVCHVSAKNDRSIE